MKDAGMITEDAAKSAEPKDMQKMSRLLDALAEERVEKAALTSLLGKMNTTIEKAMDSIGDLRSEKSELVKRVEHLEAQPMPSKGSAKAISKAQDNGGAGDGNARAEFEAELAKLSPEDRTKELIKIAYKNPVPA